MILEDIKRIYSTFWNIIQVTIYGHGPLLSIVIDLLICLLLILVGIFFMKKKKHPFIVILAWTLAGMKLVFLFASLIIMVVS